MAEPGHRHAAPDGGELVLTGYRYSVYTWIVRLTLAEKRLGARYVEVDPFARPLQDDFLDVSPFGQVPVLRHGDFTVFETAAITGYLDRLEGRRPLHPTNARAVARMDQTLGIIDTQVYPALVRQVFSNAVFRPRFGEPVDTGALDAGLARAPAILSALERIAVEGLQLAPGRLSRADLHLAPMLQYFAMADAGAALLKACPALTDWLSRMRARPGFAATDPFAA